MHGDMESKLDLIKLLEGQIIGYQSALRKTKRSETKIAMRLAIEGAKKEIKTLMATVNKEN